MRRAVAIRAFLAYSFVYREPLDVNTWSRQTLPLPLSRRESDAGLL
jgi:hypothetical protein